MKQFFFVQKQYKNSTKFAHTLELFNSVCYNIIVEYKVGVFCFVGSVAQNTLYVGNFIPNIKGVPLLSLYA